MSRRVEEPRPRSPLGVEDEAIQVTGAVVASDVPTRVKSRGRCPDADRSTAHPHSLRAGSAEPTARHAHVNGSVTISRTLNMAGQ
jgi:hypothetical protein